MKIYRGFLNIHFNDIVIYKENNFNIIDIYNLNYNSYKSIANFMINQLIIQVHYSYIFLDSDGFRKICVMSEEELNILRSNV